MAAQTILNDEQHELLQEGLLDGKTYKQIWKEHPALQHVTEKQLRRYANYRGWRSKTQSKFRRPYTDTESKALKRYLDWGYQYKEIAQEKPFVGVRDHQSLRSHASRKGWNTGRQRPWTERENKRLLAKIRKGYTLPQIYDMEDVIHPSRTLESVRTHVHNVLKVRTGWKMHRGFFTEETIRKMSASRKRWWAESPKSQKLKESLNEVRVRWREENPEKVAEQQKGWREAGRKKSRRLAQS